MSEIAKKIRAIAKLGLGPALKQAAFVRHSTNFSRHFGESLQVVNVQSSQWNSSESGKFTINVGVHFPSIAALLYAKDPMPTKPKEFHCLLRARVGMLMQGQGDGWWTVTPSTNVEEVSEELMRTCLNEILPWLEQFKTIAGTNWQPKRGFLFQHFLAEAAANLVLGDRTKALQCVEAEIERIRHEPYEATWKRQQSEDLRKWAVDHGLAIPV
jgi:hypothetical protein